MRDFLLTLLASMISAYSPLAQKINLKFKKPRLFLLDTYTQSCFSLFFFFFFFSVADLLTPNMHNSIYYYTHYEAIYTPTHHQCFSSRPTPFYFLHRCSSSFLYSYSKMLCALHTTIFYIVSPPNIFVEIPSIIFFFIGGVLRGGGRSTEVALNSETPSNKGVQSSPTCFLVCVREVSGLGHPRSCSLILCSLRRPRKKGAEESEDREDGTHHSGNRSRAWIQVSRYEQDFYGKTHESCRALDCSFLCMYLMHTGSHAAGRPGGYVYAHSSGPFRRLPPSPPARCRNPQDLRKGGGGLAMSEPLFLRVERGFTDRTGGSSSSMGRLKAPAQQPLPLTSCHRTQRRPANHKSTTRQGSSAGRVTLNVCTCVVVGSVPMVCNIRKNQNEWEFEKCKTRKRGVEGST
ncbi:putative signal peptide protein [Puccinia sorghi]|uniref:Putative signal peptide protein n=1 Tax=Puccinia sorghi TaxID=27349 RepID=A0A0L6VLM0_9BASI|nr:putative signal peptide protein [Puccinia sorghi]